MTRGSGHCHTWKWLGTSTLLTPIFDIFLSHWVPFCCLTWSYGPLFMQKQISLSLSHLVSEIIWPKVSLFFHKNLSFDTFEAICANFLLDFRYCWTPFSLLELFDPSFLQNRRYCWVHFFTTCCPPPKIWDDPLVRWLIFVKVHGTVQILTSLSLSVTSRWVNRWGFILTGALSFINVWIPSKWSY